MPRKASDNPHGVTQSGYPRLPQPSNYSSPYLEHFSFNNNLLKPFVKLLKAISICAKGTPTFLNTVESVKSLCKRDTGNFVAKCSKIALAIPRLPSAFSKSIGFTLCGMADEPHLTRLDLLLEILHGNILPKVTVQVDQDRINTLQAIENSRQIIIIRDLGSPFLTFQT